MNFLERVAMPMRLYSLLLLLLSPVFVGVTIWQAFRSKDLAYLIQRLGWLWPDYKKVRLWIHCASVGEVNAVFPLIDAVRARFLEPHEKVLITVGTPAAGALLRRRNVEGVEPAYLPIDWKWAVERMLQQFRPKCVWVMETEIWPNLYAACRRFGVSLGIINGRLSAKTAGKRGWVRRFYRRVLGDLDFVLARSQEDRDQFLSLGAPAARVQTVANIKFAPPAHGKVTAFTADKPMVLAASTHGDEEIDILRSWLRHSETESWLLVIAPRHPTRLPRILKEISGFNIDIAVRSRGDVIRPTTRVYIVDTLGELRDFIAGADLVFMGGSLVPHGGHNIIEAAQLGKACLFGPHMANFSAEAQEFLAWEGALQVGSAEELTARVIGLMKDKAAIRRLNQQAKAVAVANNDVIDRYLQALVPYCEPLTRLVAS